MQNEVEVLAQTCHAANRAFAAATGKPGIPEWGSVSESQRNGTRNRVTTELQRLRGAGIGIAASGDNPPGGNLAGGDDEDAIESGIITGIVSGVLTTQQQLGQRQAA
jgi:hypothetical protein